MKYRQRIHRLKSVGFAFVSACLAAVGTSHAVDVEVTANINADTTWTADNDYLLGGPIWVVDGATLTIEPGTTVYGYEAEGAVTPGALVITRGSKIIADGRADAPIVFTALAERDGFDDDGDPATPGVPLTLEDSGQWGGLVILGDAVLNTANADGKDFGEFKVEGFPTSTASDLVSYGGNDDDDDSGILRYVSIRYGGSILTDNNEINGLTLGAVGRGTTIEYIEVFNNSDDGVEFFGGTVDTKYMAMIFNEDESFDIDQGYRGRNQFWFALQKDVGEQSDFGGEHDGGDGDDKTLEPFARVQVYNATYIGGGPDGKTGKGVFNLKDNFAGQYHNSVFMDFRGYAIAIGGEDTIARANTAGDLSFENNLWYDIGSYDGTAASLTANGLAEEIANVSEKGNTYANPFLGGTSRLGNGGLDPRPSASGPAYSGSMSAVPGEFYSNVSYKGAFSSEDNWLKGWSRLDQLGYFDEPAAVKTDVEVTADITTDTTWSNDNNYLLGGPIWVRDGASLTIEAGTTIYGFEAEGSVTPGALVVQRGSKIFAEGTRANPIVFTALAERDGVDDDGDPATPGLPITLEDSGQWGGVVILGNSVLNTANADGKDFGEFKVEGFPTSTASDLVSYGGNDDEDSSGILRYVSIRYGGSVLTDNNEINGLTLGAVGSGTTIEYIEVFNNSDDGVEFFGSTVDTRYMAMAFNEDESFDIDQGFRGRGQFWFAVQKDVGELSDFAGEHDGGDGDDKSLEPLAEPKIYNATYIGAGPNGKSGKGVFNLKDNFAGQYHNSAFTDFRGYMVAVDGDLTKARVNEGQLRFDNNSFSDIGSFEEGNFASLTLNGSAEELLLLSEARGNKMEDVMLNSISRSADGMLDPRPSSASPLRGADLSDFPEGSTGFYVPVDYRGAFGDMNWLDGWSHLSQAGFMAAPGAGTDVMVTENISTDTTWTANNNYLLGGPIWVTDGATLTIELGTTIYGFEAEGAVTPGALVVTRGSKIFAEGTAEAPIVFTALAERDGIDDDGDPATPTIPITLEDSGQWGGLVILGNAVLNTANADGKDFGEFKVEGFPTSTASDLVTYGGNNDDDDSGVLKYVSIRYGGSVLTDNNEINGLTLGAVGRGTTIEYIEVFNNSDDGVEFFGGTVDTKYMAMIFNEDESFDIDQGYRGRNQFWFALQKDVGEQSDFGGEHDGGDGDDKTLEPFARVQVYNATYIGGGPDGKTGKGVFNLKDNFAGQYHNSVFMDFRGYAIAIGGEDTIARANTAGDLSFENNLWYDIGSYDGTAASLTANGLAEEIANVSSKGNTYANPFLGGTSRLGNGGLDPRPSASGPAYSSSLSAIPDEFYTNVSYKGAFSSEDNWLKGWSRLDQLGYFNEPAAVKTDVEVTADITTDTTWSNDNNYLLGGPIWVRDGASLTIEAGTTVYGYEAEGAVTPGALVVQRGSKIFVEGTRANPIVFTALAERDGVDDDGDPATPGLPITLEDSGQWGGVVILGNSVLNTANADGKDFGEFKVEGFPTSTASDLVSYGGNDDEDSSGILRYVSIRYGGSVLTDNNEINGLTLGAVGSGTRIEYIEVFNNSDDGVEFFGSTVDTRYMAMAFNEDESFDIDQGFRGRGQFWFAVQKDVGELSDFGGEHDGGDGDDKSLEPLAEPKIYNATYIGGGPNGKTGKGAFNLKDNFAGQYHNSVFTGFRGYGVAVGGELTLARVNDGKLRYENNTWGDFGLYDGTPASLTLNGSAEELLLVSADRGNTVEDPALRGISRTADGMLDPRPTNASPLLTASLSDFPAYQTGFYVPASYRGAFGETNWLDGWSYLSRSGFLGDLDGGSSGLADITQPGDAVVLVNGENDDDGDAGAPPAGEPVESAIDNVTQKYLNFLDLGSGLAVTPSVGATTVTGLRLYTANDVADRDPASYKLEGSVTGAEGPWSLISEGPLALPDGRNESGQIPITPDLVNQEVSFDNPWAYVAYRLVFPTLKNAGATNSMQIAEVEFLGTAGGTLDPNSPGADSDGDGTSDAVEMAIGTDPNNAAESFVITNVGAGTVSFPSADGTNFDVEYSQDLVTWTVIDSVAGAAGSTTYTDADATRLGRIEGYYRVTLK